MDEKQLIDTVKRLSPGLRRLLLVMLRNDAEVDEVMNTVFFKAWKSRDKFDVSKDPKPWLEKIARNAAVDRLRVLRRRLCWTVDNGNPEEMPHPNMDALEQLLSREHELGPDVEEAIEALPRRQRRAVELRIQGLNYKEIAVALKTTVGGVKLIMFRARRALRETLHVTKAVSDLADESSLAA